MSEIGTAAARNLGLGLLITLDALLRHRNITKASQELNISRPAVSATLARLREIFGDELLVKNGRELALSPTAEGLAKGVREIILQGQNLLLQRNEFDAKDSTRQFTIAGSEHSLEILLPRLIPKFRAAAPHASVKAAIFHQSDLAAFARGEFDVLVIPEYFVMPEHLSARLYEVSFVCIGWSQNRDLAKEIGAEQFYKTGHLIRERRSTAPRSPAGLADRIVVAAELPDYNSIAHAIVGTDLIAIVPRKIAELYARDLPLRILGSPALPKNFAEMMHWHRLKNKDQGIAWLRRLISSAAALIA